MYHIAHQEKIHHTRRFIGWMLSVMKNRRLIRSFKRMEEKVSQKRKSVVMKYELYTKYKTIAIVFRVVLEDADKDIPVKIISFFNVTFLHIHMCKESVLFALGEEIRRQTVGIENEHTFLKKFLLPTKKMYASTISYIYHASEKADTKDGIDFTVGFIPPGTDNVFPIHFNLKSSDKFIDKHKKRYSKVSTFVFKSHYLENCGKLRKNFLAFLNAAVHETVHY